MTLKLYAHPISTCTRRVQVVLDEIKVPYELVEIDMMVRFEHKTPEYLEKQPFGKIPYLDDNGFVLYESRAICHYLVTTYGNQGPNGLVPTDPKANALYHQAASVERSNFDPFAEKIIVENVFKLMSGKTPSKEDSDTAIKSLEASLDGYERILSKNKFLAGDNITIADLFHISNGSLLTAAGVSNLLNDKEKRPNVERWWSDISSRPSFKKYAYGPDGLFSKQA